MDICDGTSSVEIVDEFLCFGDTLSVDGDADAAGQDFQWLVKSLHHWPLSSLPKMFPCC